MFVRQQHDPPPPVPAERQYGGAVRVPPDERRIGEILEVLGVVGAADALLGRYEQDLGDDRRLGEILVAHGIATTEQVELALDIQTRRLLPPAARQSTAFTVDRVVDRVVDCVADPIARRRRNVQSAALFALAALAVGVIARSDGGGRTSWYGVAALSFLAIKLFGSSIYRPTRGPADRQSRVAVVISMYNEDPRAFLRCLDSVCAQTRAADEIWVIDDGSHDDMCLRLARSMLRDHAGAVVHRVERNAGKRHAQGFAFSRTRSDIVVTIDSDTVLEPTAVEEGLLPFRDPRVKAVAANVRALNHRRNLLTRLIDLRYANAFLFDRAAYSSLGSVVCCCGSLSFFRTSVVRSNLDDFLAQTFLGVQVQYGDDRRLTQYALREGRVELQDTSVAYTLVPETLGHYRRQQLRWNKSFFRESLWAIFRFGPRRWPFWISLCELAIWIAFTVSLINVTYISSLRAASLHVPWSLVAFAVTLAYARNVRYFGRTGETRSGQLFTYLCAPLYTVLHVVMLTPLRVWALCTLRKTGWGTRATVEVRT